MSALVAELFLRFCILSILAVGGANALIPEIQRQVVDVHHWLSNQEFSALFAIAQTAPGPNVMVVSLLGWQIAGLWGAAATTLGMLGPTSIFTYFFFKVWQKWPPERLRNAIQQGLAPVTIGLVLSGGFLIAAYSARTVHGISWGSGLVSIIAVLLSLKTRLNPLWIFAGAAVVGALGLL